MILAAGKATRLRPLTDNCPKCLMPLADRPLIDWTLKWLRDADVTECVINLHYFPKMVQHYIGSGERYDMSVTYSYEPELLGTAGAVKEVADFFKNDPFYIIYSDNFSQWDLKELRKTRNPIKLTEHDPYFSMAVHWREDVTSSGMVITDQNDLILKYIEKPKAEDIVSHWVNAGFYYLDPKVLNYIPDGVFYDFSYHVFPAMLAAGEHIYAIKMEDPIIGIDTIDSYERANRYADELIRSGDKIVREMDRIG